VLSTVTLRSVAAPVRQVIFTWAAGSVTMGSVAALFLGLRPGPGLGPATPGAQTIFGTGGLPPQGIDGISPLTGLPVLAIMAVFLLLFALFVALLVIAWDTSAASWVPANGHGWFWWAALTWTLGLAGWFFAATVTFAAGFGPGWQMVLGYLGGGLPFALMAALLQSSWRVNLAAAGVSAVLVMLGFFLVSARASYDPDALTLALTYLRYLLGPRFGGGFPVPIPTGPVHLNG
jgi:hypothetical protein